eukprot:NODE_5639_length_989_cov_55.174365_g5062_i0.p1 GENE.NODE_5639_length_989_cov_55.174365_g5062_i0~~NODE_5639_length_989_cov_55.174365_g5062_i0.p1  ORF type:complete len:308 (+),score=43.65 NODE_5639_length_989_cov_55.174365_g5062_i0:57-980(+)
MTEIQFEIDNGFFMVAQVWGCLEKNTKKILALHGMADNSSTFRPLAEPLIKRNPNVCIVAVDLPGHGRTSHLPLAPYSLTTYASASLAFTEKLGWKKFGLMGHSLGARVAVILAGTFPERITNCILLDAFGPATLDWDGNTRSVTDEVRTRVGAYVYHQSKVYASIDDAVDVRVRKSRPKEYPIANWAAKEIVERGTKRTANGKLMFAHDPRVWSAYDTYDDPRVLEMVNKMRDIPTIILTAGQSYRESNQKWFAPRIALLNHVEHHNFDDLKHHLHIESTDIIFPFVENHINNKMPPNNEMIISKL